MGHTFGHIYLMMLSYSACPHIAVPHNIKFLFFLFSFFPEIPCFRGSVEAGSSNRISFLPHSEVSALAPLTSVQLRMYSRAPVVCSQGRKDYGEELKCKLTPNPRVFWTPSCSAGLLFQAHQALSVALT